MANPTRAQLHFDRPLTSISIATKQDMTNFIAEQMFPAVPVSKQSDRYFVYEPRDWKRSVARVRAPSSESAGGGWNKSTESYFAEVKAVHKDVADQDRANDDEDNLDRASTEWVTEQLLLKREIDWAAAYFVTGVWGTERLGAAVPTGTQFMFWDDPDSTPIQDIKAAVRSMMSKTGKRPNVLGLSVNVFDTLTDHPDVLDRIKIGTAIPTKELLAALFGVERIVVASGIQDTSIEGSATDLSDFIMGDHALLAYAESSPAPMKASAGYNFAWTGLLGSGAWNGPTISRFRMDPIKSDRIEGEMAYAPKIVAPALGYFFGNALS